MPSSNYLLVDESNQLSSTTTFFTNNQINQTNIIFLWTLCCGVTFALGALTSWHCYLISKGETSIEKLINQRERRRLNKLKLEFVNLYDFGVFSNWKLLLGFNSCRSFFWRVVLPSAHPPYSDGVHWKFSRCSSAFTA